MVALILDTQSGAGAPLRLEFPALAEEREGQRHVPAFILNPPTAASIRAARSLAYRAVPGRDEDESEADYIERLERTLEAFGAALPEGRLDIEARVTGVVAALGLTAHAQGLIVGWEGFGAQGSEGEIDPSPEAIRAAMRIPYIAQRFEDWLTAQLAPRISEGNG